MLFVALLILMAISRRILVDAADEGSCFVQQPLPSDKRVYTVGVLAIRGAEAAYADFNRTFSDYLTATAGRRFASPDGGPHGIRFEMKPLDFVSLFTDIRDRQVDYIYVNPSAYSCIESEYGASSLASQTSRHVVEGRTYDLRRFGGVIAARADRDDIQSIQDLRGKIIAAASISGLGSGQMQVRLSELLNVYFSLFHP